MKIDFKCNVWLCFISITIICIAFNDNLLLACSAKGPQDPYTGLITYPPGKGSSAGRTEIPSIPNTPFNGTFYKAWNGNDMKIIIVPEGSQLSFEGIIKSATPLSPPRPEDWEEGAATNEYGTTVDNAPMPTWTIEGNGRGDFRGTAPPRPPDLVLKPFEKRADCMITTADPPSVKALWKLTYDKDVAKNILAMIYADPIYKSQIDTFLSSYGITKDFLELLTDAGEPDDPACGYNELELSAASLGESGLKSELVAKLPHDSQEGQIINSDLSVSRVFKNPDNSTYTVTLPQKVKILLKAGYIGMQGWYPSNRYRTKYEVTPPFGTKQEYGDSKLVLQFNTPTAPSYWIIDVQSGIETCKDCVWCWIICEVDLKSEYSVVPIGSAQKNYYDFSNPRFEIGGVLVRGYYQSGSSTAGRNTVVYVVVVDTTPPLAFEWTSNQSGITAETGKPLSQCLDGALKFKVYDNNPILGINGQITNSIFDEFPNLGDFAFVAAGQKSTGVSNSSIYEIYLKPFDPSVVGSNLQISAANLKPKIYYNICVPIVLGFSIAGNSEKFTGPFPNLVDRLPIIAQKFVWKTIDSNNITIKSQQIYTKDGTAVSNISNLQNGMRWEGYSSIEFEIPQDRFDEPVSITFSEKSRYYNLNFSEFKLQRTNANIQNLGIPGDSTRISFYKWSPKAIKIFPSVSDCVNQKPSPSEVQQILNTKYSGVDISSEEVGTWNDPAEINTTVNISPITSTIPSGITLPSSIIPGKWGKFLFVNKIIDKGKPMIALEIRNAKNEKAIMYGNFNALAEIPGFYDAIKNLNAYNIDSNKNIKLFTSNSNYNTDDKWQFDKELDNANLYLDFQNAVANQTLHPWLYDLPSGTDLGISNILNIPAFARDRIAYQYGTRERLLFRYWVWDNINTYDFTHPTFPCGIKIQPGAKECAAVGTGKTTAIVTLIDRPVFESSGGVVPQNIVWWPDYIFNNPSHDRSGNYQECSITLEAEDESSNYRKLKVFFRIIAPDVEIIRTLEDARERMR